MPSIKDVLGLGSGSHHLPIGLAGGLISRNKAIALLKPLLARVLSQVNIVGLRRSRRKAIATNVPSDINCLTTSCIYSLIAVNPRQSIRLINRTISYY